MIKRYDIVGSDIMEREYDDGEWVKWEDVKDMIFDVGITARRLQLDHYHEELVWGCGICNFIEKYKHTKLEQEIDLNP